MKHTTVTDCHQAALYADRAHVGATKTPLSLHPLTKLSGLEALREALKASLSDFFRAK